MGSERFRALADELAARDEGICSSIDEARRAAEALQRHARSCVEAFAAQARRHDGEHLTRIDVGAVEPDEKHVDCVQFRVSRGRWEAVCVAKAAGKITLVGPFKRGKAEKPCADQPLRGDAVERALEDLLLDLIGQASDRQAAP